MFPLKIRFVDSQHAFDRFHFISLRDADYVQGWSRKREGDSQLILLLLDNEDRLEDFLALCRREDSVVEITPITEDEFHAGNSNSV
ncbi:MAG: hypothetical protein BGO12_20030 [Verrucomicrobia bacterium 61-8]|nr:MAG: hypothetical protein BGO12_20030 [Verrucomicrobia bacterium 61-8]